MYCQSVSCMLGYLFVHTAGSRAHANRATEAAPLLLDFSEVLTIRRLWGAELQTVHIQDIRLTWSSPIVSDLLLIHPENDGKPAAEDHTRACELQLRYMVVAGIFCTYRRVVPSCYLIESDPTSLNEGNRLSYFVSSSFFLSFFVCTVS
jgi:hypothetical protein